MEIVGGEGWGGDGEALFRAVNGSGGAFPRRREDFSLSSLVFGGKKGLFFEERFKPSPSDYDEKTGKTGREDISR